MVALNCLHHLIEAQAARTPDSPALVFEGERLTYAELEHRARGLAAHLRRLGAGPEVPVGLFVERSAELIVGLLGILKAGAAYVPMDTAYPRERLAYIVSDAAIGLVVTQQAIADRLPGCGVRSVALERVDWQPQDALACDAGPENLAYVIYTSGSTGKPKGVGVEHRNIVNYVKGVMERLRLEPGLHYATVSTIAADLGNTVVFPALATGGCLHVISQARAESPALLAEYFRRERIDVLKIVPSHLAALQSGSGGLETVMPARCLVLGGEPSRLDWIERLRAAAPRCRIFNHYGPTETTVGVLTYEVEGTLRPTPSGTLPLGKALPGSEIHLLDEHGREVAPGEKGELCIGGAGVARGYLNRPELTAEKFVPDPFSARPGARLYRSGDLARALPDGSFEFCGRIDHQIKLHGYRVELGEIEAALREHAGVLEAVVLACADGAGDTQVAAYVVATPTQGALYGEQPAPASLREFLKERLPPYMLPSHFVLMERLPLNANGKVDRQALAALPLASAAPQMPYAAPRSATEKTLAAIWAELLQREQVGIHDDLFDLGAHSLMAMRALARMREAFGANLALRNLFERPTIAAVAELIDALGSLATAGEARAPGEAKAGGGREEIVL